jgi:hypothetical protein
MLELPIRYIAVSLPGAIQESSGFASLSSRLACNYWDNIVKYITAIRFHILHYIAACRPVAKQRLSKRHPLLGNRFLTRTNRLTGKRCSLRGLCYSCVPQQRNCWKRCFLCDPCRGVISRTSLEFWTIRQPARRWTWKLKKLRHSKPLPGDKRWRYSRLRTLSACCSELLNMRISDSAVVTCSYSVRVKWVQLSIQTPSTATISPFKITLSLDAISIMQSGYVIKWSGGRGESKRRQFQLSFRQW